ncbi:uncharacterized protein, partial [Dermacentor andersoni]|uniref:uncharacterized protein n=1 Tax=Dermacentor andersoni TaxID=34620 RepID=UPI003B3A9928
HGFLQAISVGQTIDVNVSHRINDFVREGITSVQEMKKCISYCVHDVLLAGRQPPDSSYAFHATNRHKISAIKSVFPHRKIQLWDFHNEQAWKRWRLAHATCSNALKSLRESVFWKNIGFQEYMLAHWIPMSEMWVKYHRQQFAVMFTTNSETESQNKLLKEFYLEGGRGRRSSTGLITGLVKQFFPDWQQQFCQQNILWSASYRVYHEGIPGYLHNRPPIAVKHRMSRLHTAMCHSKEAVASGDKQGIFKAKSSVPGEFHTVDFNCPSCSCQDFAKSKLSCKHFCAVFNNNQDFMFNSLPESYKLGQLLTIHSGQATPEADSSYQMQKLKPTTVCKEPLLEGSRMAYLRSGALFERLQK